MFTFWPHLFILIIFPFCTIFVLNLWSLYTQRVLTRFEGNLNRGIVIGVKPINWHARQFLEALPTSIHYDGYFIRKDANEIIIGEEKHIEIFGSRRRSWAHIAYVNLNASSNQIEFRVSWVSLVSLISNIPLTFIFFYGIISLPPSQGPQSFSFYFFLIIFIVIYLISIIFVHYRECNRLLNILNQVIELTQ